MATWYDLPQEVKHTILEQVVKGTIIKFVPRHAGTRSSRARTATNRPAQVDTVDSKINSLLLVSKNFVTYNELEPVLLSSATIRLEDSRTINKLAKRFTNDVFGSIQELAMVIGRQGRVETRQLTNSLKSERGLLASASALQRIIIIYSETMTTYGLSLPEIVQLARGAAVSQRSFMSSAERTASGRSHMRNLLIHVLVWHWWYGSIIQKVLAGAVTGDQRDVVLRWNERILDDTDNKSVPQQFEFSTKHWCVQTMISNETLYLPQRMDAYDYLLDELVDKPLLEKIEAVELDKYYTI